jgi:PAS domain S-box-containing protein
MAVTLATSFFRNKTGTRTPLRHSHGRERPIRISPISNDKGTDLRRTPGDMTHHIPETEQSNRASAFEICAQDCEHLFPEFVTLLSDAIFIFTDERISFISPRGLDLLGSKSLNDLSGRLLWDMVHPDDQSKAMHRYARCYGEGTSCPFEELRVIRADGRIQDIEASWDRIRIDGKPAGFSVWRDISERKQVERTLHRYHLITENSRDIILFMRLSDGRILDANKAALNAYGYTRYEMLELTISDLRAPENRESIREQMSLADTKGTLFETIHQTKDGRRLSVEVSSQGATIDGCRTLISVIRDISDRKSAAQQLLELDAAVKVVLKKNEEREREVEKRVLLRTKNMILPFVEKLSGSKLSELQRSYLTMIENNLNEIVAPFTSLESVNYYGLTEKEVQVVDLIKRGKSTKEIAGSLKSSKRAIDFHRNNLRRKFGLSNQKANLRDYLLKLK